MKFAHLKAVSEIFANFTKINFIRRVAQNVIVIDFSSEAWAFDMTRAKSLIYPSSAAGWLESFGAPFDEALRRLCGAKLTGAALLNSDKILSLKLTRQASYKTQNFELIFELTGKHTNAIVLEGGLIIQALHLINENLSFRTVKLKQAYVLPPKPDFVPADLSVGDVRAELLDLASKASRDEEARLKSSQINRIQSKIAAARAELLALKSREDLMRQAQDLTLDAQTLLLHANDKSKFFAPREFADETGRKRLIAPFKQMSISKSAGEYFRQAKKLRQKANNQFLQEVNLQEKIDFYENLAKNIASGSGVEFLRRVLPPKREKKETTQGIIETFIQDYKVFVGVNRAANKKVLDLAKANDLWFHIKDIPSSHLVLRTKKQNVSAGVIREAARLCAVYSKAKSGRYNVDYTQRKFVKQGGEAKVLYTHFSTASVEI